MVMKVIIKLNQNLTLGIKLEYLNGKGLLIKDIYLIGQQSYLQLVKY
jgi:hypothetical protein